MGVGIKHKWKTHEATSPTQAPPLCTHRERQLLERGWLTLTKSSEFLLPSPHPWGFCPSTLCLLESQPWFLLPLPPTVASVTPFWDPSSLKD